MKPLPNQKATLHAQTAPVRASTLRFTVSQFGHPRASFWKLWASKNEVYLSGRSMGSDFKLSVHESGAIHWRMQEKLKQDLAPLARLPSGTWSHAVELRFLLSEGTHPPFRALESIRGKSAHVFELPDEFYLCLNLIFGPKGTDDDCPLPGEFPNAERIWQTRLTDGRHSVLVGRILKLDDENLGHIRRIRDEVRPTVTSRTPIIGERSLEVLQINWSSNGNIILVVPMGEEGFRSEQDAIRNAPNIPDQLMLYQRVDMIANIAAPDGQTVATLAIPGHSTCLRVVDGNAITFELGRATLNLNSAALRQGEKFIARPVQVSCPTRIGPLAPKEWTYTISADFDGQILRVAVAPLSAALRTKANEVDLLEERELLLTAPPGGLRLSATPQEPTASAPFEIRLLLRQRDGKGAATPPPNDSATRLFPAMSAGIG